jgi:hypothetical protein
VPPKTEIRPLEARSTFNLIIRLYSNDRRRRVDVLQPRTDSRPGDRSDGAIVFTADDIQQGRTCFASAA